MYMKGDLGWLTLLLNGFSFRFAYGCLLELGFPEGKLISPHSGPRPFAILLAFDEKIDEVFMDSTDL